MNGVVTRRGVVLFLIALTLAIVLAVFVDVWAVVVVGIGVVVLVMRGVLDGAAGEAGRRVYRQFTANPFELFRGGKRPMTVEGAVKSAGMYVAGVDNADPAALVEIDEKGAGKSYLTRDADLEIDEWLLGERSKVSMLVVEGVAGAGKSRTILEALGRSYKSHALVRPRDAKALMELAKNKPRALKNRSCVIWLDDLENWLLDEQFPFQLDCLDGLENWPEPVMVAATMGGSGLTNLKLRGSDDLIIHAPIQDFVNGLEGRDSKTFHLNSQLSEAELASATVLYGANAPELIDAAGGLGSYLIAGPHLIDRFNNAPEISHALISAAIHWRRFGIVRGIPREVLEKVHGEFVLPPGRPAEDVTEGLRFAVEPVFSSQLLTLDDRDPESYRPRDYLVSRVVVPEYGDRFVERILEACSELEQLLVLRSVGERGGSDSEDFVKAVKYSDGLGNAEATAQLAGILARQGRDEDSRLALVRADEGGSAVGAFYIGVSLDKEGKEKEAEAAYRRADERGHPAAAFAMGTRYRDRDDVKAAEEAFTRGAERGNADAAHNLGVILRERGDHWTARVVFRRADQLGSASSAFNVGALAYREGRLAMAEKAWRRADDRGGGEGSMGLGVLSYKQGNIDDATAAWRRAKKRGSRVSAYEIGMIDGNSQDADVFEAAYRKATEQQDEYVTDD